MKKFVIVTGGKGFIGYNLCNYLSKYYNVISIDNLNLKQIFKKKKFHKDYNFSIGNKKKIEVIIKKYKPLFIYNLAAESHVDNSIKNPSKIIKNNIGETYNFIQVVLNNISFLGKNFKFIHLSTDEVYGSIKKNSKKIFNENSNLLPNSPYSSSKAAIDLIIRSLVETYKFPAIIIRSCNNFGPYQHYEKLIPKIIQNAMKFKKIPIYAKGDQVREWVFVKDVIKQIHLISKKGLLGEIYNIGSGFRINNINLTKKILSKISYIQNIDKQKLFQLIENVKDRPGHDFKYAVSSKKTDKLIKYKYKSSFDDKLEETILWYKKKLDD